MGPRMPPVSCQPGKEKNEGLCLVCAKEMGIPQVSEYMEQMGITDEDLDDFSNQIMDFDDGENFEMGGSGTLPAFIQNILTNSSEELPPDIFPNSKEKEINKQDKKKRPEKEKEKKYVKESAANKLIADYERNGVLPAFRDNKYDQERKLDLLNVIKEIYCIDQSAAYSG